MKTHEAGSKSSGVGVVPEMELENLAEHCHSQGTKALPEPASYADRR